MSQLGATGELLASNELPAAVAVDGVVSQMHSIGTAVMGVLPSRIVAEIAIPRLGVAVVHGPAPPMLASLIRSGGVHGPAVVEGSIARLEGDECSLLQPLCRQLPCHTLIEADLAVVRRDGHIVEAAVLLRHFVQCDPAGYTPAVEVKKAILVEAVGAPIRSRIVVGGLVIQVVEPQLEIGRE